ncbi:MAG: hypothetical protein HZB10_02920 [Candidatus Yonathbacteria bacterium]|nr:hypothetical protein [Candidatus Yonathbacteria bacterium]
MKIQKTFSMGCRMPGNIVLDVLRGVAAQPYQKAWTVDVDQKTHQVVIACFRWSDTKREIVPGVKIKILESVNPDLMFNHVTAELEVLGLKHVLSVKKILKDFEDLEKAFKKGFEIYPKPYRVFNSH